MSNIITQTISTIKHWWVFLITGILLILTGVYVIQTPEQTYPVLAQVFSIMVLLNGIAYVYFSISNKKYLDGWGWYLAGGIFEILVGAMLIYYPEVSLITLPLFVGFWFLFRGISIMGASFELKSYGILDWGYLLLLGFVLTIAASFMLLTPFLGYLNVIFVTSLGLFIFGVAQIVLAFKLKKIKKHTIDKFEKIRKAVKKEVKELRKKIEENIEKVTKEEKENIEKAFENYESSF